MNIENRIPNPEEIYFKKLWKLSRDPFKHISAENISDKDILDIFIFNDDLYLDVFDINDSIIKGEKGTGKTMLLKAIYNFYSYKAILDINQNKKISCIPVFINLSQFNHIHDENEIFKRIILSIIDEMTSFYDKINDITFSEKWYLRLISWIKNIFKNDKSIQEEYEELSAESIKEIFTERSKLNSELASGIAKIKSELSEEYQKEIVKDKYIGVSNIKKLFDKYFNQYADNILLLIDEVSSLDKKFFEKTEEADSFYLKLINQFRTTPNLHYKIAIYPHHFSDQLEETRYGKSINLQLYAYNPDTMASNRKLVKKFIETYVKNYRIETNQYENLCDYIQISKIEDEHYVGSSYNDESEECGDSIEQIIFGSRGTYRRIMQICSEAFTIVAKESPTSLFISKKVINQALFKYGENLYNKFKANDQQEISNIAKICRKRTRCRFTYPGGTPYLNKFLEKGTQDNIIYLLQLGKGKAASVFEFDYAFCIYVNLPTHLLKHIEKSATSRSLTNGIFLERNAKIDFESIQGVEVFEGSIKKVILRKGFGFITYSNEITQGAKDIFFHVKDSSLTDAEFNALKIEQKVSFKIKETEKGDAAFNIKLLD